MNNYLMFQTICLFCLYPVAQEKKYAQIKETKVPCWFRNIPLRTTKTTSIEVGKYENSMVLSVGRQSLLF